MVKPFEFNDFAWLNPMVVIPSSNRPWKPRFSLGARAAGLHLGDRDESVMTKWFHQ